MSLTDLPKAYDPHDAQRRWYAFWLEKGYFHANPASPKPPYTIVIPPPNVTGALHLGHALNNTLQDILIRWRRMQGYDALWMPGTDHAGIATQAVVEKRLFEEEKKTRHDLGREALVERIWAWKDEYEKRILSQLRLMGCSCDWERTRFTLDEGCSRAVRETFFRLFKAGKIYRGKRLVNWDTQLRTAVADDEIYYEEIQGKLWTIKYPVVGSETGEALLVATTRPETMLGDTAVAVHTEDPRYRHLIGRKVDLPLTGRQVPIIADSILVDPKFGTGCVKVTPAHDPNDYQTGVRHQLPMINLLNPDGTFNENAGAYAGLPGRVIRKRVVEDLEAQGLLAKEEPYTTRLNFSDRSKTPIEPYLSDQWFVRMGDGHHSEAGFAQLAIEAVTRGRMKIHPERYAKTYIDWLSEKRDWCISRQLWWGHRIPVWFKTVTVEEAERCGIGIGSGGHGVALHGASLASESAEFASFRATSASDDDGDACEVSLLCCIAPGHEDFERRLETEGFRQDPDVLDTWFSSALWPHSTLGWPERTPELEKYYPTSVLSTARDIITLWVARMVIFGQFNMGDVPFHDVYIHPVIQDGEGKRMSKMAGNGIDPVDIIESFGADTLRFTLASIATETQDIRMPVEQVKNAQGQVAIRRAYGQPIEWVSPEEAKNVPKGQRVNTSERFEQARPFPNKFWNASRFAMMNLEGYTAGPVGVTALPVEDRWILSRLRATAAEVTSDLGSFQFADAARRLRDFTWNEFCDWYVEFIKGRLRDTSQRPTAQRVLATVLDGLCRLLHPIMPFVSEQVWQALRSIAQCRGLPEPGDSAESVCIAPWPEYPTTWNDPEAESVVAQWREKIEAIRNLRAERNVPPAAKVAPIIVAGEALASMLRKGEAILPTLPGVNASTITIATQSKGRPTDAAIAVLADAEVILPLEGLIDKSAEVAKLRKALADVDKQLPGVRSKLANEQFLSRAPADVVAGLRAKESELVAQRDSIQKLLDTPGSSA